MRKAVAAFGVALIVLMAIGAGVAFYLVYAVNHPAVLGEDGVYYDDFVLRRWPFGGMGDDLKAIIRTTKPEERSGEMHESSLVIDGYRRDFAYYVPLRLREPAPLVIVLHAFFRTPQNVQIASGFAFDFLADREGFLVAYPAAFGGRWNGLDATGLDDEIDDVEFMRQLISFFEHEYGVDPRKVFYFGHSNGGVLAHRIAIDAPELMAGFAANAANIPKPVLSQAPLDETAPPTSALILHSQKDHYEGGRPDTAERWKNWLLGIYYDDLSIPETFRFWADRAGYEGEPEEERIGNAIVYTFDEPGRPVVRHIATVDGGHNIPNEKFHDESGVNNDVTAAAEAWRLFETQLERRTAAPR